MMPIVIDHTRSGGDIGAALRTFGRAAPVAMDVSQAIDADVQQRAQNDALVQLAEQIMGGGAGAPATGSSSVGAGPEFVGPPSPGDDGLSSMAGGAPPPQGINPAAQGDLDQRYGKVMDKLRRGNDPNTTMAALKIMQAERGRQEAIAGAQQYITSAIEAGVIPEDQAEMLTQLAGSMPDDVVGIVGDLWEESSNVAARQQQWTQDAAGFMGQFVTPNSSPQVSALGERLGGMIESGSIPRRDAMKQMLELEEAMDSYVGHIGRQLNLSGSDIVSLYRQSRSPSLDYDDIRGRAEEMAGSDNREGPTAFVQGAGGGGASASGVGEKSGPPPITKQDIQYADAVMDKGLGYLDGKTKSAIMKQAERGMGKGEDEAIKFIGNVLRQFEEDNQELVYGASIDIIAEAIYAHLAGASE